MTSATKTRLLVTGGSGFIGTNAITHFAADCDVLNLDIAEPRNPEHGRFWKRVDLLDADKLREAVSRFSPHWVLHLAARTDLDGKTLDDYAANTTGVSNLLQALADAPSLQRAVLASSMLVCRVGHVPGSELDFCPTNPYGESKVAGEKLLRASPPRCSWLIVRPTSVWGPWFREPYRNFFDYVLKGRYFHIGKTKARKTYGYVGNVVYQLDALLSAPAPDVDGRVFYLGDSSEYVIRDWADAIASRQRLRITEIPLSLVRAGALMGDLLMHMGVRFPMTSFRLRNMTTENCIDLRPIQRIASRLPYDRAQAIDLTLEWMKQHP